MLSVIVAGRRIPVDLNLSLLYSSPRIDGSDLSAFHLLC